ncbi:hypothetical protein E6W39_14155 [Kitasatospora acidiphila]|uniref:Bulb-type lectin domain-containing protein n=1 Tax=Kitasatospora acidiphila TaxID=2567942 RepID=A0A540W2C7_9ACTN|nr:ricin-type beta-trefoil lectin domain protein [Kitasatospora acidiphila]TQF03179.1 hypothetical protein E6W39_14155 [Kitasatospora acidiphila]
MTFDSNGIPTATLTPPTNTPLVSAVVGSNNSTLCADDGGGISDGATVRLWQCNSTPAQAVTYGADNTLHFVGKCLDVTKAGTAAGTKVQLWTCNGSPAQQWVPGTSAGSLQNPNSGMCLDDPQGSTDGTAQLQIWACNSTSSQNWASGTALPTPQTILNIGLNSTTFPSVITPGDVNGDGNPDLYAVNNLQQVYEYPGVAPNGSTPRLGNPVTLGLLGANVNPTLTGGSILRPGDTAYSGHTRLVMQPDGNLVLYSLKTGQSLWSTKTYNNPGAWATMQTDGNLVVYKPLTDANGNPTYPTPGTAANTLWSSATPGNSGAKAVVQDDCNFVI